MTEGVTKTNVEKTKIVLFFYLFVEVVHSRNKHV